MTDARVTQTSVEQWVTATDVPAQITQIAIEQWATLGVVSTLGLVTQAALEEWVGLPPIISPGLNFPDSPTTDQIYTHGDCSWQWDGVKWGSYCPPVAAGAPLLNYVDNSGFSINQRGYVSGTALAAGIFGHDRWKAGAGGATYTFTPSVPATTVTITAGTLQQVIEGASLVGGNYVLSWTGTAQGRVGAGSYAASPVAVAGIAAGANTTIEFNAGTLGQVNLTAGTVAAPWFSLPAQQELARCQRFASIITVTNRAYAPVAGAIFAHTVTYPQTMRATPTASSISGGTAINIAAATFSPVDARNAAYSMTASAAGDTLAASVIYLLSADL